MKIETVLEREKKIAVVFSEDVVLQDVQSSLELILSVKYETGAERIVLNKESIAEPFFILSTGLAGEVLQKFVNYHVKVAVYGDYSRYTSKPLRDFIYESNHGKDVFFLGTREEAIRKLGEV